MLRDVSWALPALGARGVYHCKLHHRPREHQGSDFHPQLLSDAHVPLWPLAGAYFKPGGDGEIGHLGLGGGIWQTPRGLRPSL